ncbi:hypothetical protein [Sphingomonas sp. 1P08PE]|uniref:hypothetical protein n=1 Tax=Sphingomonas sp. 1P08PE TaxID=554122 RepID=UPI0039A39118
MGQAIDIAAVRADLTARITALDVRAPYAGAAQIAADLDMIRRIAHAAGLDPVVTVTHFLCTVLARGNGSIHGWLSLLVDAVAAESSDLATCDVFAAACSVRLAA